MQASLKPLAKSAASIKPVVWLALFLDSAAFGTALPVIPKLIEQLVHGNVALAASYYGALLAMSGVLLFFCGPIQAALSDRFGRKRVLMAASFGSALSFIAFTAAGNMVALFAAQVIYAISGASYPVAACYVGDSSSSETRTRNFSHLSGILTLGFIVGTALGGMLAQLGLNIAMYAASLSCFSAVALMFIFFNDSFKPTTTTPLNNQPVRAFFQTQIDSFKFLFSRASLAELSIVMVCGDFAFQTFLSTWVLFTTLRFHWTISQAGASMALEGLFSAAVQIVFLQYALPRWGVAKTLIASLFFDALALVLYNCVDGSLIVVGVIALHCMGAAVKPTCNAALSGAVTAAEQAKLQGALASQMALSTVLASLLGTSCFSYFTSTAAPFVFPGVSMLVGFLALVLAMTVVLRPQLAALVRVRRSAVAERF